MPVKREVRLPHESGNKSLLGRVIDQAKAETAKDEAKAAESQSGDPRTDAPAEGTEGRAVESASAVQTEVPAGAQTKVEVTVSTTQPQTKAEAAELEAAYLTPEHWFKMSKGGLVFIPNIDYISAVRKLREGEGTSFDADSDRVRYTFYIRSGDSGTHDSYSTLEEAEAVRHSLAAQVTSLFNSY